jgi:flavin reductase (DIM6/NTAB) family NADH-FMN oxidoreductase RutF
MIRRLCLIGILALLFMAGAWHDVFPSEEMATPDMLKPAEDEGVEKVSLGARTVIYPTLVWVIGSYDKEGKPNVMTSSWAGICSSKPASVMTCLRKATYTHGNILERKAFTVNIAAESLAPQAAYVGRVSGRKVDKFKRTGLTPVKSTLVDAPYVKEFPLIVECQLKKTIELGSHTMFIGEIKDVKVDPSILDETGTPDMAKLKPFVFAPGSSKFYGIGQLLGKVNELAKKAEK